jgi:transcription elongation factor Elf1
MDKPKSKKTKVICPVCNGNGFIRVPYRLTKEEVTAQCGVCDSEGEIYVDSDGIHRLH